jgi:hypothetical protein
VKKSAGHILAKPGNIPEALGVAKTIEFLLRIDLWPQTRLRQLWCRWRTNFGCFSTIFGRPLANPQGLRMRELDAVERDLNSALLGGLPARKMNTLQCRASASMSHSRFACLRFFDAIFLRCFLVRAVAVKSGSV